MPIVEPTPANVAAAAEALRRGDLVAFPTETVYGLGADATNSRAVARIFEAKGRPRFNPLIAHVADLAAAERIAHFPPHALKLAEAFWPGPLTLVLRKRLEGKISDFVTVGLETIGVRVPAHPVAQALLRAVGRPLAAPSANRSGHVSPTLAAHVYGDLAEVPAFILDGGPTAHGLESTILDAAEPGVIQLRAGALAADAIEHVLGAALLRAGEAIDPATGERPVAPGQLASHYAPRAALRLDATDVRSGEALLAFGPRAPRHAGPTINLSASGDLVEAGARLFSALRELDAARPAAIAVMPIPDTGIGEAINDRLRRGAAPR
jgi:L-threonylcarbamoyladenylate synthase